MPYSSSTGEQAASWPVVDRQASTGADLLLSLAETATAASRGDTKLSGSKGSVTPSPVSSSMEGERASGKGARRTSATHISDSIGAATQLPSHLECPDSKESKKRAGSLSGMDQIVAASIKRARTERVVTNEEESRGEASSKQGRNVTVEKKDGGEDQTGSMQPVISPSSSDEVQQTPEGEVSTTSQVKGAAGTPHPPPFYPGQPYYPAHHGFGRPMPYMQPAPFGHPNFGYPPRTFGPMPFYGMMPAHAQPPLAPVSLYNSCRPTPATSTSLAAAKSSSPGGHHPKSSTPGKDHTDLTSLVDALPSNSRCVQLKGPVPTRAWGPVDSDDAQSIKLPDFCQLVNFPGYLARNRGGDPKCGVAVAEGKRHCVMCGKLRVCSATTSLTGRSRGFADGDPGGSVHIIPRQNKGVCTACDVTVWLIRDREDLQIKWCKGCKNFRPWAAFGEKGMATKCVRCRRRQKEKYAAAKVGAEKRGKQGRSSDNEN